MKFNVAVDLCTQGNYKEAFDMFFECDLTDMEVQYWIGYMYLEGLGVEQDRNKGETWLLKSAQQGDSSAQLMLGVIYREIGRASL